MNVRSALVALMGLAPMLLALITAVAAFAAFGVLGWQVAGLLGLLFGIAVAGALLLWGETRLHLRSRLASRIEQ